MAVIAGDHGRYSDDGCAPLNFFMTVLGRASCSDRLVSKMVVITSRSESVRSDTRRTVIQVGVTRVELPGWVPDIEAVMLNEGDDFPHR